MVSSNRIEFGWAVPTFAGSRDSHIDTPCYEALDYYATRDTLVLCERMGFDAAWIADHFILGVDHATLECWTSLSAFASMTKRIRLGTLVLCNAHRHPSVLAKMAATLDNISEGRLELGIGAGWFKHEMLSYGLPWVDSVPVRVEQLCEAIEIIKRMWTESKASFEGKYYAIRDCVCEPKPVQKPHPPIWIGSLGGKKIMPKVIAKYANGWNTIGSCEDFGMRLRRIKKECELIGRDFNTLKLSWDGHVLIASTEAKLEELKRGIVSLNPKYPSYTHFDRDAIRSHGVVEKLSWEEFSRMNLVGTPTQVSARIREYVELGVSHFMLWFLDFPSIEGMKLFAQEVMPQFR